MIFWWFYQILSHAPPGGECFAPPPSTRGSAPIQALENKVPQRNRSWNDGGYSTGPPKLKTSILTAEGVQKLRIATPPSMGSRKKANATKHGSANSHFLNTPREIHVSPKLGDFLNRLGDSAILFKIANKIDDGDSFWNPCPASHSKNMHKWAIIKRILM